MVTPSSAPIGTATANMRARADLDARGREPRGHAGRRLLAVGPLVVDAAWVADPPHAVTAQADDQADGDSGAGEGDDPRRPMRAGEVLVSASTPS